MTREEAIRKLQNFADHAYPNEEFVMAIKALEQESCKDCISRHAAKRIIFDEFEGFPTDEEVAQLKRLTRQFDDLPSVTPKEPNTQFVEKSNFDIMQYNNDLQSAYDCGKASQEQTRFCPNCGTKMEKEE